MHDISFSKVAFEAEEINSLNAEVNRCTKALIGGRSLSISNIPIDLTNIHRTSTKCIYPLKLYLSNLLKKVRVNRFK